jgi:AraC-like DNA-binding protein
MLATNIGIFNIGFIVYTRNYRFFPHILSLSTIATFFMGACMHIFIRQVLFPEIKRRKFIHFIPGIVVVLGSIPYQLKPGNEKIRLMDKLFTGEMTIAESFFCGSAAIVGLFISAVYVGYSWFLLRKKQKILGKNLNGKKSLKVHDWVVHTVYGNVFIDGILIVFSVVSILAGLNINILYRAVPFIAASYISILGIRILFQPEFFLLDNTSNFIPETQPDSLYIVGEAMKGRIMSSIAGQELYKDPNLTLNELAKKVGVPRTALSKTINSEFNVNFYDFINRFRIDAIKERIKDNPWDTNILEAAYKSGFKSKTTFNVCFKRYENMTPSQFRNRLLKQKQQIASI